MIRNLLATTAIVTIATFNGQPAMADEATKQNDAAMSAEYVQSASAGAHLASDLIGKEIYNGTGDDAESIGEVEDLVVAKDGSVETLIVGVGGFLGIGEKDVAVKYNAVSWSKDKDGDSVLLLETTKEALKQAPEYDYAALAVDTSNTDPAKKGAVDMAATKAMTDTNAAATKSATDNKDMAQAKPMTDNKDAAEARPADRFGPDFAAMKPTPSDKIEAEKLIGTVVYGANDENIGEVGDIVLTKDGLVDAVILDVGGFLGIGEKPVAIGFDALEILSDSDGDLVIRTAFTQEQLESAPEYSEDGYKQDRDKLRLTQRPAQ